MTFLLQGGRVHLAGRAWVVGWVGRGIYNHLGESAVLLPNLLRCLAQMARSEFGEGLHSMSFFARLR